MTNEIKAYVITGTRTGKYMDIADMTTEELTAVLAEAEKPSFFDGVLDGESHVEEYKMELANRG